MLCQRPDRMINLTMISLTANIADELLPAGGFSEGSKFVLEATASHGALQVERLTPVQNGSVVKPAARQSAIERFLRHWRGKGGNLPAQLDELADERLVDLLHKHLK